ncbi:hypothetical protein FACS1894102_2410 [Spirochaetia bacterium]|nr:hypothetical protein FACS1894102_2410 [Spirochaetia bacterium]
MNDLQLENQAKKSFGIQDFSLLTTTGVIGDYKECELTHIYLMEKKTNKLFHYYAIISYEEYFESNIELQDIHLTSKPIPITTEYNLGISQMRISLDKSKNIFEQLCENYLTFKDVSFFLSQNMQLLPKTHIPTLWGYDTVLLNKILKPNLWGDKYILEFISNENPFDGIFSSVEFEKINAEILKYIPIDLSAVHDRIGSFIFQFPITLVIGTERMTDDWCTAKISIKTYSPFSQDSDISTAISTHCDNLVTGFNSFDGIYDNVNVNLGDSRDFEVKIFNKTNKLIYKHMKCNFIRSFNINGMIGIQNSEPRTFINSNSENVEINLLSSGLSVETREKRNYDDKIQRRIFQNEIIKKSGRFKVFYPGEREKALGYIRETINKENAAEIWLWDPFLRATDVFDTLYYKNNTDVKMKCISSFTRKHRIKNETYETLKKNQYDSFFNPPNNNLGLNLEFRAVHDDKGFDFHDRFLFFVSSNSDEIPVVFSLGTSINSLGNSHHLVQQTLDPRELVHSFVELWDKLDDESSCIIKLPTEVKL